MNRNDTRVLIGQKTRIASIVLFMVVYFNTAESGWKQLGFAGNEITALCIGKEALHATSAVFTAVHDSGVFAISLPNDSIYKYPYPFNENDQPAGKIHALLVSKDGNTVFAGTDSGLYETSLLSSSLPAWKKIPSVTAEPVYDRSGKPLHIRRFLRTN